MEELFKYLEVKNRGGTMSFGWKILNTIGLFIGICITISFLFDMLNVVFVDPVKGFGGLIGSFIMFLFGCSIIVKCIKNYKKVKQS